MVTHVTGPLWECPKIVKGEEKSRDNGPVQGPSCNRVCFPKHCHGTYPAYSGVSGYRQFPLSECTGLLNVSVAILLLDVTAVLWKTW